MTTMREAFIQTTTRLLDTREDICVVLADIGQALFHVSGALRRHPTRVINVGIREQLMIGVAAGMALEGFRPIVHTYAPFLVERPYEQIKLDLAHQNLGAVLVSVGASYDAAAAGRTHQAPEDVTLMYTIPGATVYVPGHPDEVITALEVESSGEGIAYIRLSDETNERPYPEGVSGFVEIQKGSERSATIIAVGPALQPVIDGCKDFDVSILYTAMPRPMNSAHLRSAVRGTEIILVEPYLEGTTGADVSRILADSPRRLLSIGVPNVEHRRYGTSDEHRKAYGLDASGIRNRVQGFLQLE